MKSAWQNWTRRSFKMSYFWCSDLISYSLLPSSPPSLPPLPQTEKFHISITFLDYLAQYATYKVWVKPQSEMGFLYGNNIVKSGLGRMTEGIPQYAGVVVFSMTDIPLGFGVAAQPTEVCKDLDPGANVVLHQGDVGEYLRVEDELS